MNDSPAYSFATLEDLRAAIRTRVGPTPWMTIAQPRIDAFAEATEDRQWLHVDTERASTGPFGATIAHGYLTLALIPYFRTQLFELEFGSARVNYGLDKVRFPAAVAAAKRVRAAAEFLDIRPAATGHLLAIRYTVELEGNPKPACIADTLTLLLP